MTGNICVYCPGGPDSDFEYSTQSYTGYEPTSMRAIRARYDPYLQTRHRIEQVSKIIFKTQLTVMMDKTGAFFVWENMEIFFLLNHFPLGRRLKDLHLSWCHC